MTIDAYALSEVINRNSDTPGGVANRVGSGVIPGSRESMVEWNLYWQGRTADGTSNAMAGLIAQLRGYLETRGD